MIKKYDKLICIILMLCMLVPIRSVVVNASDDIQLNEAFSLLTTLGVVSPDIELEKIDMAKPITRADFAVHFSAMLDTGAANMQTLYYNDLPRTHYAYNEITALTEMGYLSGYDKKFKPDELIMKDHAVSALIKVILPANIMNNIEAYGTLKSKVISDSELFDGVSGSENVTYRDMLLMLFNTLKADCYRSRSAKGSDFNYEREEGYSVLYKTRNMRYVENETVTAANGADIYGVAEGANDVVIDGVLYNSEGADYSRFVGRRVNFVYAEDEDTVVWMYKRGNDDVLEFFFDEDCRYDAQSRKIYYYDGTRERSVQLSSGINVIYNGKYVGSGISEILSTPRYKLTLLNVQKSKYYDVAVVEAYTNIFVGEKDDKKQCVYDKNTNEMLSLDLVNYSIMKILSADGDNLSYEDIQANTVLSVFKSKDKDFLRVEVSSDTVSGVVDSISNEEIKSVTIDGADYKVYSADVSDDIAIGATVTAYFDCMGYIAATDLSFAGKNQFVGFGLKGYYDKIEEKIVIRVLSETGAVDSYTIKDKININGKAYKRIDTAFGILAPGGTFKKTLLLFTLNEEGGLNRIDTPLVDDGNIHPFTIGKQLDSNLSSKWQATYRPTQGKVGLTMLANSATKVFYVPEDFSDETECSVGKLVAESDYRGAVSYRTNNDTFYEQYIVVRRSQGTTISDLTSIMMLNKIITAVNEDEEEVYVLICNDGRQEAQYELIEMLNPDDYNLKKGDAVQLGFNGDGKVDALKVVYRVDSDEQLTSNGGLLWPDKEGRIITCYANDKSGYALKVGWNDGSTFDEIFNLNSSTPIVVYDSETNTVEAGTISDIKTYETNGNASSKLLIQTNYSALNQILVFN